MGICLWEFVYVNLFMGICRWEFVDGNLSMGICLWEFVYRNLLTGIRSSRYGSPTLGNSKNGNITRRQINNFTKNA